MASWILRAWRGEVSSARPERCGFFSPEQEDSAVRRPAAGTGHGNCLRIRNQPCVLPGEGRWRCSPIPCQRSNCRPPLRRCSRRSERRADAYGSHSARCTAMICCCISNAGGVSVCGASTAGTRRPAGRRGSRPDAGRRGGSSTRISRATPQDQGRRRGAGDDCRAHGISHVKVRHRALHPRFAFV